MSSRSSPSAVARLLSVNVGQPREVEWDGRTVRTAIWKAPVAGRRFVRRLNIDGDGQADLVGHGGEHRAVLVYQIESHRHWQRELGREPFGFGEFGENFTVEGLPDDEVCIGDRFRIGTALFEVTQPRVTCFKVGVRLSEPRMPALLVAHGRPGFYLRVLAEGEVAPGDLIEKEADGKDGITVREIDSLLYLPGATAPQLRRAIALPALPTGWRDSFTAMLDRPAASAEAPAWPGFRPFRVAAITAESQDVVSFHLKPADGEPLPAFLPGQFLTLRLHPPGAPGATLRSYSLSRAPDPHHYRVSVKRERDGTGSGFLHAHVKIGDRLDVAAPRGSFTLDADSDAPIVLLSAGIGATPVLAMLAELAARNSPREVWWLHGARRRAEHPFAEEAGALIRALPNAHGHVRYSRPDATDVPGRSHDATGRLDATVLADLGVPRDAEFYLCGPVAFLRDVKAGLLAWGAASERMHSEIFGPEPVDDAHAEPHPPPGPPGTGPQVGFARSGLTVAWGDRFASLLELAEACDVPVRWSCRTGVCHTCEAGLLDGRVTYNPEPLDPPEASTILTCCSRPHGDLALDL